MAIGIDYDQIIVSTGKEIGITPRVQDMMIVLFLFHFFCFSGCQKAGLCMNLDLIGFKLKIQLLLS